MPKGASLSRPCLFRVYAKPLPFLQLVALDLEVVAGVHLAFYLIVHGRLSLVLQLVIDFTNRDKAAVLVIARPAYALALIAPFIAALELGERTNLDQILAVLHNIAEMLLPDLAGISRTLPELRVGVQRHQAILRPFFPSCA
jgi:hypothetical protein